MHVSTTGPATTSSVPEDHSHGRARARALVLVPLLLLAVMAVLVARNGDRITAAMGHNPPPADAFAISRVEFEGQEIRVHVRNPQPEPLTLATVTVDDAIVPYEVDGPRRIGRLGSRVVTIPYAWVEDDPHLIGLTSSSGIQTTHEVPAAVAREGVTASGLAAGALIGALVGIVPVALGLLWLPSLRQASPRLLAAFLALTAGLLTFVAIDAFAEAVELQARLPGALSGTGVMLLGMSASFLLVSWLGNRRGAGRGSGGGLALATLVAIGIGLHNLGEGLAIGSSFALGELALGVFLIVGFMVHNVTEGLGIAVPATGSPRLRPVRAAALVAVAGVPTIVGVWLGRYVVSDLVAVLFFSLAVGAAVQVVVEVGRYARRLSPGGLMSGANVAGFLAGVVVMYATGLLAG